MCSAAPRDGWPPIALAPDDCNLELGHIRVAGIEALRFPCRRKSGINEAVLVHPANWRSWR